MYVTEDTTRADPETLRSSIRRRSAPARHACASPTPSATRRPRAPRRGRASWRSGRGVRRRTSASTGTATATAASPSVNTLAALEAGATRLHGAALGIGERVGNTPMDLLLVNLVLMGYLDRDLTALGEYCAGGVGARPACRFRRTIRWSAATRSAPRPACTRRRSSRPSGRTTATLVDAVYSGVPASMVGREQEIEVGPMSGKSNVIFWLESRGLAADEGAVDRIFAKAKASDCVLTRG